MLTSVRRLFSFLLILALPFQGIAGTGMMLCKTSHHSDQAAGKLAHQNLVQSQSHTMMDHDAAKSAMHANHSVDSVKLSPCSACNFCCHFSALPSFINILVAPQHALPVLSFDTSPPLEPVLAGLQRPPRLRLA